MDLAQKFIREGKAYRVSFWFATGNLLAGVSVLPTGKPVEVQAEFPGNPSSGVGVNTTG